MSRIISGLAGSIKLKPAAKSTRPTSDRVKESLFAILDNIGAIEGSRVLDLYAGSGALGLEAASRGATEVIFVERDKAAAAVVRENMWLVGKGLNDRVLLTVHQKDVSKFITTLAGNYNLVFIDPPYEVNNDIISSDLARLAQNLETGSHVVVERSSRSESLAPPSGFEERECRVFGDTRIYIWTWAGYQALPQPSL